MEPLSYRALARDRDLEQAANTLRSHLNSALAGFIDPPEEENYNPYSPFTDILGRAIKIELTAAIANLELRMAREAASGECQSLPLEARADWLRSQAWQVIESNSLDGEPGREISAISLLTQKLRREVATLAYDRCQDLIARLIQ